jgi:hypothetical protein
MVYQSNDHKLKRNTENCKQKPNHEKDRNQTSNHEYKPHLNLNRPCYILQVPEDHFLIICYQLWKLTTQVSSQKKFRTSLAYGAVSKTRKQDLVQHYDVIEQHERTSHGGTIINTHLASQQAKQNKNEKPLIFIIQKINGTKKNLKKPEYKTRSNQTHLYSLYSNKLTKTI